MKLKLRGAFLKATKPVQVSENLSIQDVYLDTSSYNNFTGERYNNLVKLQVLNGRVEISQFKRGQVMDVEFYLNGRTYQRKDGTQGFAQNLNLFSAELSRNTSGEVIVLPEDQLLNINID